MTKRHAMLMVVAAALVGTVALGAAGDTPLLGQGRKWVEGQALTLAATYTRAAPTLATEGMSLTNVSGYRVQVCANQPSDGGVGALFGTGNLRAWYWDPYSDGGANAWHRDPGLDLSQSGSYVICQAFPDVHTEVPYGRVLFAADTMVNDGGVGVTVSIQAKTVPK